MSDVYDALKRARIEFPGVLKRLGYDREGNHRGVDPAKHLLHAAGSTPALDKRAVKWWKKYGVTRIRVHLTDGRLMTCDLGAFMDGAVTVDYGHGSQFANASVWTTADPGDLFEQVHRS